MASVRMEGVGRTRFSGAHRGGWIDQLSYMRGRVGRQGSEAADAYVKKDVVKEQWKCLEDRRFPWVRPGNPTNGQGE